MKRILLFIFSLQLCSCLISPRDKDKGFYKCFHEDWDYEIIPLVKPYYLGTPTNGKNWHFMCDTDQVGGFDETLCFGVSKGCVFGKGRAYHMRKDSTYWFLFDFKTQLYASYNTQNELMNCMRSLDIPITKIKGWREYQNDLDSYGKCYWYPNEGEEYKDYLNIKPLDLVELTVNRKNKRVEFKVDSEIKFHENRIYFFKFIIDDTKNDLLYFDIESDSDYTNFGSDFHNLKSGLIKDGAVIPVCIRSKKIVVTLYTPYPVSREKGIPDNERIYIKKKCKIVSDKKINFKDA